MVNWDSIAEDLIKLGVGSSFAAAIGWLLNYIRKLKKGLDCAFPRIREIEKHLGLNKKID